MIPERQFCEPASADDAAGARRRAADRLRLARLSQSPRRQRTDHQPPARRRLRARPNPMTARRPSSSTPAASSTAPRPNRSPRSARRRPRTARSSSPAAWAPNPRRSEAKFPNLLSITGPQDFESVMQAVHAAAPPPHDPFLDLLPPQGIKLTPRHYAYLKISEGCNNRCSFCIIPKLRGDLVSRPAADVLREAEKLVAAGVRELLVISQDTSAYGLDLRYAESLLPRARGPGQIHRSRRANWASSAPGCGSIMSIPIRMSTRSSN